MTDYEKARDEWLEKALHAEAAGYVVLAETYFARARYYKQMELRHRDAGAAARFAET